MENLTNKLISNMKQNKQNSEISIEEVDTDNKKVIEENKSECKCKSKRSECECKDSIDVITLLKKISKQLEDNHHEMLSLYGVLYNISHYLREEVVPRLQKSDMETEKDKYILNRLHAMEDNLYRSWDYE